MGNWTDTVLTHQQITGCVGASTVPKDPTWKDFSLARMALIEAKTAGCGTVLPPPSEAALIEFRNHLEGIMDADNLRFFDLRSKVLKGEFPVGSLGDSLLNHYRRNGIGAGDSTDVFPLRYIFLHDAHHALLDCNTDMQGEMNVISFECGQIDQGRSVAALMPVLAQVLAFSAELKEKVGTVEDLRQGKVPPREHPLRIAAEYWAIGTHVEGELLDRWEIEADLPLPVEQVRQKYGITIPAL